MVRSLLSSKATAAASCGSLTCGNVAVGPAGPVGRAAGGSRMGGRARGAPGSWMPPRAVGGTVVIFRCRAGRMAGSAARAAKMARAARTVQLLRRTAGSRWAARAGVTGGLLAQGRGGLGLAADQVAAAGEPAVEPDAATAPDAPYPTPATPAPQATPATASRPIPSLLTAGSRA